MDISGGGQSWHTEQWFTSPWNHDPEVASRWSMDHDVVIHDVTLRDGDQQAGVMFTADDKLRIAEALAEARVQRIEAGLPAEDERAVREIAMRGLPSTIYAFSRCMVPDVELAVACGVDGVVMEIPSSRHLIELGMRTLFRLGGEYAHVMTPFVASGEHMAPPHRISSDKIIRHGDIVFVDIGASWGGYYGDVARATVCGKPSQRQREIHTAVYEALQAGIATMRPGRTNEDTARAIVATAGEHGLGGGSCRCSSATGSASARTSRPTSGRRCPARRW